MQYFQIGSVKFFKILLFNIINDLNKFWYKIYYERHFLLPFEHNLNFFFRVIH